MTHATSASEIRQWARDNGMAVGDRGRLAPELHAAYAAAHTSTPAAVGQALSDIEKATENRTEITPSARLRVAANPRPGADGVSRRIAARGR